VRQVRRSIARIQTVVNAKNAEAAAK